MTRYVSYPSLELHTNAWTHDRSDNGDIARALVAAGADMHLRATGLSGACGVSLSKAVEERGALLELARRHRNWLKRRVLVMSLAHLGLGGRGRGLPRCASSHRVLPLE